MVPGHARIHEPEVAVGAAAEDHQRSADLKGALAAAVWADVGTGDQKPGVAPERAGGLVQIASRAADLAVLNGCAAYHSGQDPERTGGQVADALEPHPNRAHERVALLLGVLAGKRGQLDAEAVGIHVEARVVVLGHLDDKVIRYQGAALGDDGRPVIHLTLDRTRDLDRLKL